MTEDFKLTYGPVEFPDGWKPPPPPTPEEFRKMVEGTIKEKGLTGPEAAAFRQRYRKYTHPVDRGARAHGRMPPPKISDDKANELAGTVGSQLGLDVDALKKRMGVD